MAAVLLVAFAYYYVVLPPINIHAPGFWIFVIVLAAVFTGVVGLCSMTMTEYYKEWAGRQWKQSKPEFKSKKAERFSIYVRYLQRHWLLFSNRRTAVI